MSNSRPELQRVDEGVEEMGQMRTFDLVGRPHSPFVKVVQDKNDRVE